MHEMTQEILTDLKQKMNNYKDSMLTQFSNIRTGVANPKILDKITINYYGAETVLKHISMISIVEGNQIHIKPFDATLLPNIKKALLASDLGITPQTDGVSIKLVFPQPTEEKRKLLTKEVEKISEQTKVIVRNLRRSGNDKVKKLKLAEDEKNALLKQIQDLNNHFIKLLETETVKKNKELLKI
ncbi:MAG: ribosome recycling factor ['Conium maculatum' witches'-broom phytoplasma]|nr:ribosome recycling factor ['Conium maculatum' witches'-broom phytoplasma]